MHVVAPHPPLLFPERSATSASFQEACDDSPYFDIMSHDRWTMIHCIGYRGRSRAGLQVAITRDWLLDRSFHFCLHGLDASVCEVWTPAPRCTSVAWGSHA